MGVKTGWIIGGAITALLVILSYTLVGDGNACEAIAALRYP
jgi:hypothetical protein